MRTPEQPCVVRAAKWPSDESAAEALLRHYASYLESGPNGTAHIDSSGLMNDLHDLSTIYKEPGAVLLLAWVDGHAAGCVAVKILHRAHSCELKRLWTEPEFRGQGLGLALVQAAMHWARSQGADVLLLDTQPEAMPQAVALYRFLGFTETERYNDNPVPGLLFMELSLR